MALTKVQEAGNVTADTMPTKITNILDGYYTEICVPEPFTGGTAGTRGAFGTLPAFNLFDVTGEVKVIVYGVCTTDLAGATATVEVGLTGNTPLILPQVVGTTVTAGDVWVDNSVGEVRGFAATSLPAATYITNDSDIIETSGTANITSGNIYYVCLWIPISPNGRVRAVRPRVN